MGQTKSEARHSYKGRQLQAKENGELAMGAVKTTYCDGCGGRDGDASDRFSIPVVFPSDYFARRGKKAGRFIEKLETDVENGENTG